MHNVRMSCILLFVLHVFVSPAEALEESKRNIDVVQEESDEDDDDDGSEHSSQENLQAILAKEPPLTEADVLAFVNAFLNSRKREDRLALVARIAEIQDERLLPTFMLGLKSKSLRSKVIPLAAEWPHPDISAYLIALSERSSYPVTETLTALAKHRSEATRKRLEQLRWAPDFSVSSLANDLYLKHFPQKPATPGPPKTSPSASLVPAIATGREGKDSSTDHTPAPQSRIAYDPDAPETEHSDIKPVQQQHVGETQNNGTQTVAAAQEPQPDYARASLIALNSLFGAHTMGTIAKLGGTNAVLYAASGALVGGASTYIWSMYQPFSFRDTTYVGTFGTWGALSGAATYRLLGTDEDSTQLASIFGESLGLGYGLFTLDKQEYSATDLLFANLGGTVTSAGVLGLLAQAPDRGSPKQVKQRILYGSLLAAGWGGFTYHLLNTEKFSFEREGNLPFLAGASAKGMYDGYALSLLLSETPLVRNRVGATAAVGAMYYYGALHAMPAVDLSEERRKAYLFHNTLWAGLGVTLAHSQDNKPLRGGVMLGSSLVGTGLSLLTTPYTESDDYSNHRIKAMIAGGLGGASFRSLFPGMDESDSTMSLASGVIAGYAAEAYLRPHVDHKKSIVLPSVPLGFATGFLGGASYSLLNGGNGPDAFFASGLGGSVLYHAFPEAFSQARDKQAALWSIMGAFYGGLLPAAFNTGGKAPQGILIGASSTYLGSTAALNLRPEWDTEDVSFFLGFPLFLGMGHGTLLSFNDVGKRPWTDLAAASGIPGVVFGKYYISEDILKDNMSGLAFMGLVGGQFNTTASSLGSQAYQDKDSHLGGLFLLGSTSAIAGSLIAIKHFGVNNDDLLQAAGFATLGSVIGMGSAHQGLERDGKAATIIGLSSKIALPTLYFSLRKPYQGEDVIADQLSSAFVGGYAGVLTAGLINGAHSAPLTSGGGAGAALGYTLATFNRMYGEDHWHTSKHLLAGSMIGLGIGGGIALGSDTIRGRGTYATLLATSTLSSAYFASQGPDILPPRPALLAYTTSLGAYAGTGISYAVYNWDDNHHPKSLIKADVGNSELYSEREKLLGRMLVGVGSGGLAAHLLATHYDPSAMTLAKHYIGLAGGTALGAGLSLALYPQVDHSIPYAATTTLGLASSLAAPMLFAEKDLSEKDIPTATSFGIVAATQGALISSGLEAAPHRRIGVALSASALGATLGYGLNAASLMPQDQLLIVANSVFLGNLLGAGASFAWSTSPENAELSAAGAGLAMLPLGYVFRERLASLSPEQGNAFAYYGAVGMAYGTLGSSLIASDQIRRRYFIAFGGGAAGVLSGLFLESSDKRPALDIQRNLFWGAHGTLLGYGTGLMAPDFGYNRAMSVAGGTLLGAPLSLLADRLDSHDPPLGAKPVQTMAAGAYGLAQGIGWSWVLNYGNFGGENKAIGGAMVGYSLGMLTGRYSQASYTLSNGDLLLLGSGALYGGWISFLFADLVENKGYRYTIMSSLLGSNAGLATTMLSLQSNANVNSTRLYIIKLSSLAGMGLFPPIGRLLGLSIKQSILAGGIGGLVASTIITSAYEWVKPQAPVVALADKPSELPKMTLLPVVSAIPARESDPRSPTLLMVGVQGMGL